MQTFGADTTTEEVLAGLDLTGRRFAVTGASSGLGIETCRALAAHGATVVMLARDPAKAEAAAAQIRDRHADAQLEFGLVDLADLSSIETFAGEFLDGGGSLDVLINNAGIMACPREDTSDGFEMQFGTNHLGHFALTGRLMPALREGDGPRVVTLSSAGHSMGDVDVDDPNFESIAYDPWVAYGRSKSANALFARGLATRAGNRLVSVSVHPGGIRTDLGRHLTPELMADLVNRSEDSSGPGGGGGLKFKTLEAGAATQVWAATQAGLEDHNGAYLADCRLGELGAPTLDHGMLPHILDDATADRLWDFSVEATGVDPAAGL